jgi:hypothetical protein
MSARALFRTLGLSPLESDVLQAIMDAHPDQADLILTQLDHATIASRRRTGVGFFLNFAVSPPTLFEPANFELNDVYGDLEGLEHGAGFLLFIRKGKLDFLEGHTFGDEDWPAAIGDYEIAIRSPTRGVVH